MTVAGNTAEGEKGGKRREEECTKTQIKVTKKQKKKKKNGGRGKEEIRGNQLCVLWGGVGRWGKEKNTITKRFNKRNARHALGAKASRSS